MERTYTNRLINESSPYLLQHAHNPVNWYPWGSEALERAKNENKIILVSIGYSACHWCHVMERESFENETTAALMNENFINIKIDREERPDIDHIYMDAVQAMTGSGGWPLNVFLTPETKPFYGGTYFPPVKAFNRPSWTDVLMGVSESWKERKNEIESQAENVTAHLQQSGNMVTLKYNPGGETVADNFSAGDCESIFGNIIKTADVEWGGFGNAPKFPQTFTIQYLLQYYYFTGNKTALQHALLSIDKMLQGGIYDHVGGGLARYSTDKEWLAPHFEKMLYDNALLVNILCDAYQITGNHIYAEAINKTVSFILQDLTDKEGAYYAALDADSEGEEGKYYVWEKSEVDKILGEDAALFCAFFDVTEKGNWEGKNILRILKSSEAFAKEKEIEKGRFDTFINGCLQKLKTERNKRILPGLDDKIILGWNALMLKSIAKASIVLGNDAYREAAIANFNFIQKHFKNTETANELFHTWKNGTAKYPAFLDDYACLIDACLQLYEATYDTKYLLAAENYCSYVIDNFSDEEKTFFYYTNIKQSDVIVRKKEIYDGATPSGNAVMASNLIRLSIIFDRSDWKVRAGTMLKSISSLVIKYPGSFGIWASAILQQTVGINEIAIVGTGAKSMAVNLLLRYIPNKIIMATEEQIAGFPLLAEKTNNGPALIYLCRNYECREPVNSEQKLYDEIVKNNKISEVKHNK